MKLTKYIFVALFFTALFAPSQANALSGSDFNPGRIIDDEIFFNKDTMSASQIQSFLEEKMPECDTNGDKYHNGVRRRDYSASNPAPFTCLKDYYQNPTTGADNYGGAAIPSGAKRASQIIYDVAQAEGINPQVLIVLLQKEQSLITDDWPWKIQYRSATGYGCPDTAACDSEYYGFYNQVSWAAKQFNMYVNNPAGYNYEAGMNNNIHFHPDLARCGNSTVYIENPATAALYNYTPYQPNQAALDNLYGSGDSCSAYGNRNFWRMFNDWFGDTLYKYKVIPVIKDGSSDKTGEFATVQFYATTKPTNTVEITFKVSSPSNIKFYGPNKISITPNNWNKKEAHTLTIEGLNNPNLIDEFSYFITVDNVKTNDSNYKNSPLLELEKIDLLQIDSASDFKLIELQGPDSSYHYTTNNQYASQLVGSGWSLTGNDITLCQAGNLMLHEATKGPEQLFYTPSKQKNSQLEADGYSLKGPSILSTSKGGLDVYKYVHSTSGDTVYSVNSNLSLPSYTKLDVAFKSCSEGTLATYRLYRDNTKSHLFTTSWTERNNAIKQLGFRYEGVGFYSCESGQSVFRLYRPAVGNHFYTSSVTERDNAVNNLGYRYENANTKACSATGGTQVYRMFQKDSINHLYTTSLSEYNSAQNSGYRQEGAKFLGY